ncbi:hypothetical protein [Treponema sp.]|uniref:hypothetical protein n=1 Tax=Treponema sp. TaxID=166 RepID=UPI003FA29911
MTKKASFFFTASCLILLVPVPPRFAFGIVFILCAAVIVLAAVMLKALIEYIGVKKYKNLLFMPGILAVTLFLYALVGLWSPVTAFTFGFIMYILPVSLFMNASVFADEHCSLKEMLIRELKNCAVLSVSGLFFFAARELLAYGTLSLPVRSGLQVFGILKGLGFFPVFFWATIPGALVLLAFLLVALAAVYRRYGIKEDAL